MKWVYSNDCGGGAKSRASLDYAGVVATADPFHSTTTTIMTKIKPETLWIMRGVAVVSPPQPLPSQTHSTPPPQPP
ncbi:hypothetical protein VNO80_01423 [Phaseolus coccineus]|uniref:Uncharacterized protein n=1 Tax=Phaseolus coccineus TaxID=3886 RepID=A0AAN9WWP1_PHACN